jgi:hypothetical protein
MSNSQKAQKYLLAAHAGAALLCAALAAAEFGAPDFVQGLFVGMLFAIIFILFRSTLRDEYIERLWNAGTAAALLATLVATLGVELVRGFADQRADIFEAAPLFSTTSIGVIALAAFFIGFHFKLLRERA